MVKIKEANKEYDTLYLMLQFLKDIICVQYNNLIHTSNAVIYCTY